MKISRFKIVRFINGQWEKLDFIGPFDKIPQGWFYPLKIIRGMKR